MSRRPPDIVWPGSDVVLLNKEWDEGVVLKEEVGAVLEGKVALLRGEELTGDVEGALEGGGHTCDQSREALHNTLV